MVILHLSEGPLPDTRVEKAAYFYRERGEKQYFIGSGQKKPLFMGMSQTDLFDGIITVESSNQSRLGLPFYYNRYKSEIEEQIKKLSPDIIHAHNIFAAKLCHDLKLNYIYDDHEFWTLTSIWRQRENTSLFSLNTITDRLFKHNMFKWESQIAKSANAIITASPQHKTMFSEINKISQDKIFVIQNFPAKMEVESLHYYDKDKEYIETILVTKFAKSFTESTRKYLETLHQFNIKVKLLGKYPNLKIPSNVDYKGYVPHKEFLNELEKSHIGLNPFGRDKIPEYYTIGSPNRIFYYAHAGVIPVVGNKMDNLKILLENLSIIAENELDAAKQIKKWMDDPEKILEIGQKLQNFAKSNLIYEKQVDELERAYHYD